MYRKLAYVLTLSVICAVPLIAQADAIPLLKNVTTGATVFTDDFEGQTVGTQPGAPWTGGIYGGGVNSVVATCDYASQGVPAYQGDRYVKLYRPNESGGVYLQGIGGNSDAGETIRLEIAFRIDGTESSVYAMNANGNPIAQFGMFGNGDVAIVTPNQQEWGILTQKSNVGEWNVLVVEHVNDVDSWSVSVNGAAPETGQGFTGMSGSDWVGIKLQSDSRNSTGYWDAVPEPTTVALLSLGAIGVLRRRLR
ncbi:MAG: PEP-CTERM sorting domain-containing protein [Phycisphaerae bacterium]|nr:PEP-CTERM sorting domain-containing protein [Phycisphaerae bacterium]